MLEHMKIELEIKRVILMDILIIGDRGSWLDHTPILKKSYIRQPIQYFMWELLT